MNLLNMIEKWYIKFTNSEFWFNVYYRYTKQHKTNLKNVSDRVYAKRKSILSK